MAGGVGWGWLGIGGEIGNRYHTKLVSTLPN
jgi:hypothetical protein